MAPGAKEDLPLACSLVMGDSFHPEGTAFGSDGIEPIPGVGLPSLSAEPWCHYLSSHRVCNLPAWPRTECHVRQPKRWESGPRAVGATGHITPSVSPTSCPPKTKMLRDDNFGGWRTIPQDP